MRSLLIITAFSTLMTFSFCYKKDSKAINSTVEKMEALQVVFYPDTSINGKVYLNNSASVLKTFGDAMRYRDRDADLPDVFYSDKENKEYLRMVFLPGGGANSFGQFEVGYVSDLPKDKNAHSSNLNGFITETSVKLGMPFKNLVSLKGDTYIKEPNKDGLIIIRYVIDDFNNSKMLKRYNMPSYFAEYCFKKDKLIKYKFGFDMP